MPEPLRLLVVSDEMEVGGSQRQIASLLGALPPELCRAQLAYFRNPSFLVGQIEGAGIAVHRIDKRGRIDPGFVLRLVRFLRHGRFDVVHCFSFTAELWTRLALLLAPGAALVASMRDMGHGLSPLQWRIKRLVCRGACVVISNSLGAAERLRAELGARPPVHVVVNGMELPPMIDANRLDTLRIEMGARDDARPLALFVGRLTHQKNVDLLLRAVAALEPGLRPRVALAGDGPLHDELQSTVRRLQLDDDIRFLGERSDARELMQAADFVVLPSRDEGLSNVVLEAMAAGRPVMATRVGGNPELVKDGVTGLLFDSGDVDALAQALRRLAADPGLRARMGEAARARIADRYSPAVLARDTLAVYRACLEPA